MARGPIVLESNLNPNGYSNRGALDNIRYGPGESEGVGPTVENEDGSYTSPLYQLQSNTPDFAPGDMQNLYGTQYMPSFNWVSPHQTRENTYNPDDDKFDPADMRQQPGDVDEGNPEGAAIGSTLGTAVGSAFFGPIGGAIGGALGGAIGGRVICNELMRQGVMTRKQVVLDYKFTRDYLTPRHVAGYHIWAVWMVGQMRKGRFVSFWTHVAGHRANEISYIYGEKDKPDYLGKIYRKILEPICWTVGLLCRDTDWSILYKQKGV